MIKAVQRPQQVLGRDRTMTRPLAVALLAQSQDDLKSRTRHFAEWFEPVLSDLEAAIKSGRLRSSLPEFEQYLQVCRWPFRQLEYSFAIEILLGQLKSGDSFLDAGSGVTPLAQAIARREIRALACDADHRIISELQSLPLEDVYGVAVEYSAQSLIRLDYPDASFDGVACISVLEHIPAPFDQQAVRELLRVLKPGGVLVATVDFTPREQYRRAGRGLYFLQRACSLTASGQLLELGRAITRRANAQSVVRAGAAQVPRTANQCFGIEHLESDLLPLLETTTEPLPLAGRVALESVTSSDARRLWGLRPGLFELQGKRSVVPAAFAVRKMADA